MTKLDRRRKNADWLVSNQDGNPWPMETYGRQMIATLMDIRDELQRANVTREHHLARIDRILRTISKKIPARRKGI